MARLKRNPKKWRTNQLLKQKPEYRKKGELGLAKKAVKSYIAKRFGNCHQMVKAKGIAIFLKTNPQINPYHAVEAFSRFLVEPSELILAGNELGLEHQKVLEAIERGKP